METGIALVGKPNSGKSALFNALTGARQKVANYPGVTVERKEGYFRLGDGTPVRLLDLPGTYSLRAESQDEQITSDALQGKITDTPLPEILICLVDATCLRLSLPLVFEVLSLGLPVILVLNKMDVATRLGYQISKTALSEELGVPVVAMSATRRGDTAALLDAIASEIKKSAPLKPQKFVPKAYTNQVRHLMEKVLIQRGKRDKATTILDNVFLHPLWGGISFLIIISLVFQGVFNLATLPMDMIDKGVTELIGFVNNTLPDSAFKSLLGDGIIAGVGSVVIFLPQILILFLFILVLEDSGYMARAAFLLDRMMGRVGLHGKAFIPLLSSFACAIPGIMAARTIENTRDRLVTILIAPLMTCSARLPVYTLIISAFIPNTPVFGFFRLQGLVLLGLYLAGILSAMLVAVVIRRFFLKGKRTPFLLEMPDYSLPNLRNIVLGLLERSKAFLMRAGRIILPLMILVWFLSSYPQAPEGVSGPDILYSFAGMIGHFLSPVFEPLGFNWQMVVALIPGMAAREVAVGVLGTVYALSSDASLQSLGSALAAQWSLPTALSFLTWYVFAPQCLATLGVVRRETNSWFWPFIMLCYLMALAYLCSFIVFNLSQWIIG